MSPAKHAMDSQPNVSIIIVNWNSVAFLRKCLASIFRNSRRLSFEVVVVDNASHDGCAELLKREFPSVAFVQSEKNLGFARANNLGSRYSSAPYLLFLNPDTEIVGSAIEEMSRCLDEQPRSAIVGARLLNSDGSIQDTCIRRFPTLLTELLDFELLRRKFPRASLWGMKALYEPAAGNCAVDVVSGAALMIRRDVFEEIGCFTTSYFMYAEDVDLCLKAGQAGWTTFYVPDAVIVHHGGRSSGSSPQSNFADVVLCESRGRFFTTHRGATYAACYRISVALSAMIRLSLLAPVWIFAQLFFERNPASAPIRKWARLLSWSLGGESWAGKLPPIEDPAFSSVRSVQNS